MKISITYRELCQVLSLLLAGAITHPPLHVKKFRLIIFAGLVCLYILPMY